MPAVVAVPVVAFVVVVDLVAGAFTIVTLGSFAVAVVEVAPLRVVAVVVSAACAVTAPASRSATIAASAGDAWRALLLGCIAASLRLRVRVLALRRGGRGVRVERVGGDGQAGLRRRAVALLGLRVGQQLEVRDLHDPLHVRELGEELPD